MTSNPHTLITKYRVETHLQLVSRAAVEGGRTSFPLRRLLAGEVLKREDFELRKEAAAASKLARRDQLRCVGGVCGWM